VFVFFACIANVLYLLCTSAILWCRLDSMSGVLMKLHLPTADTVLHNSHIMSHRQ